MLENARSSLTRGLPEVSQCRAHHRVLSVAGNGPSLEDTWDRLHGYIAAANGSLRFLLEQGIVPHACGVIDANAHMTDIVAANNKVTYFLASICHPSLFDKLAHCHVVVWHPTVIPGLEELLEERDAENWLQIGGGCTIGLRWVNLGYVCGFRRFVLHGMDSSFRPDGTQYASRDSAGKWDTHIEICGRKTKPSFMAQVTDFSMLISRLQEPDVEPVEIDVLGDGLLQDCWARYVANEGRISAPEAFQRDDLKFVDGVAWPMHDIFCERALKLEIGGIDRVLSNVQRFGTCVQAGGNAGLYPKALAKRFDRVITAEPDLVNFRCMQENLRGIDNVEMLHAAFGEGDEPIGLVRDPHNSGAHYIDIDCGSQITQRRIDDLNLAACDMIWLDVEGYEGRALRGAAETIKRFKPVVVIEAKGHDDKYGDDVTAVDWLEQRGYRMVDRVAADLVFAPK